MNKIMGKYKNGNYQVIIQKDGTKIRETQEEQFIPEFAENIDVKICNRCDMGCVMCHEDSTPNGKLGDILNQKWVDSLKPYQELAVGGGNVLEHPDLIPFLKKLKEKQVIANLTLHQEHFEYNEKLIKGLIDEKLIYGIGISLSDPTIEFIRKVRKYQNAVIHVINGIVKEDDIKMLSDHSLKILILGYKNIRRGTLYLKKEETLIRDRQKWLYDNMEYLFRHFKVVSFDNLAIEQLDIKRCLTKKEWDEFYMGDDGTSTFYIDTVERTFSKNSMTPLECRYPLLSDVVEMFHKVNEY